MINPATWGEEHKRLKIDGHWYDYHQTLLTKNDARLATKYFRSSGIRAARIIKKTGGIYKHTRYLVYVRNL